MKLTPEEVAAIQKHCPEWDADSNDLSMNEKRLIIIASVRFDRDRTDMADALEISRESLIFKIRLHKLVDKI
jgi:transcriptional regulator with PAS, ATPase and Fis domain